MGRRFRTQADIDWEQQLFNDSCERAAYRIAAIIESIRGLGDEWDNLSTESQQEFIDVWTKIISEELS